MDKKGKELIVEQIKDSRIGLDFVEDAIMALNPDISEPPIHHWRDERGISCIQFYQDKYLWE